MIYFHDIHVIYTLHSHLNKQILYYTTCIQTFTMVY